MTIKSYFMSNVFPMFFNYFSSWDSASRSQKKLLNEEIILQYLYCP